MKISKSIPLIAAAIMLILSMPIIKASASEVTPEVTRLSGQDRYETSANISKNNWKASENVVLSSGQGDDKFADALAGTALAYEINSPMLLTNTDYIPEVISNEIKRLNAKNIYLLGGTGVIDSSVESDLKNQGYNVIRLSGQSRYETAAKIGEEAGKYKSITGAFLTTGYKFQYAMAASPYVGKENAIILFTDGNSLNPITKDIINKLNINKVTIMGGDDVVSPSIDNQLKNMGVIVERIGGNMPEDFAANVLSSLGKDITGLAVANDRTFADSLSGSVVAAENNLGMALIDNEFNYNISKDKVTKILIYGGYISVSQQMENYLKNIMGMENSSNSVTNHDVTPNLSGKANKPILSDEKDWYEAVKASISNCQDQLTYDNIHSSTMPEDIVKIVLEQNPDMDYVESYNISNNGSIRFNYRFSKDELTGIKNKTNEKAEAVLSNIIKPDMTQTDKAKAIHDYIAVNAKYDYDGYIKNTEPVEDYTAYGILVNGTGVCQGYAAAFNLMARMSGIKSIAVQGTANGGTHVWNMVMLDGKIGYIDTTWDDPIPDREGQIIYDYFDISEDKMEKDHLWDEENFTENYLDY
ncbi:cell wall-binding repeat-containing protein [Clostridium sp. JNZ X4-2]